MAEIFARLNELLSSVWSYPIRWDDALFVVLVIVLAVPGLAIVMVILAIVFRIYNFILDVFRSWLTPRGQPVEDESLWVVACGAAGRGVRRLRRAKRLDRASDG